MFKCKKKMKLTIMSIFIVLILLILFVLYSKAFLTTDPNEVIPPDSFIKEGAVITLIEEDEKYFIKTENFSSTGEYQTPAMEKQIDYNEYAQIRANGEYDILEKRNRHIINDIYVDEYYKAYQDGEIMAGNYIAEVLDGYFIPVEIEPFKETHKVLINDGGIRYLATYRYDKDYNYAGPASYLLLSENQYNEYYINQDFDYIKDIEWEISYDGNTIVKTINYFDKNEELIMRPIIVQMTGFEDLEEYINPEDIPEDKEDDKEEDKEDDKTPDKDTGKDDNKDDDKNTGNKPSGNNNSNSGNKGNSGDKDSEKEEPWLGSDVSLNDSKDVFNTEFNWSLSPEDGLESGGTGDFDETNTVTGFYDEAGNFIPVDDDGNIKPSEDGVFDENGNFTPNTGNGYYDADGVWHPEDAGNGEYDEDGNFVTDDETYDEDGNVVDNNKENNTTENGHYDEDGNFVQNDGTIIDEDGVVHKPVDGIEMIDVNGNKTIKPQGLLTLDFYGRIVLFGFDGYYDEHGLVYLPDGKVGYYNEDGRFFESRQNAYSDKGGFYDINGDFHLFNTIYTTENGTTQLILYPEIGLATNGLTLTLTDSIYEYTANGLTTVSGKKGYFNEDKEFIKSDKSAYKGGFYTEKGAWIDDSLYKVNSKNEIELSYGYFDTYGVYVSPNKDRGYFNEQGKFIINRENPYEDGYYKWDSSKQNFGEIYLDELGNIHRTGSDEIITSKGQVTKGTSLKGIIDKNGNWFNKGIVITPKSEIGYYNEFKEFKEGQIPYLYGYYDADGYFYRYDNLVISPDGKVGYFDESGNWVDGVKGATLDKNGNWVLPDGTVILPDGTKGYYDENGNFIAGEKSVVSIELPQGAIIDSNANVVLADGTVVLADGTKGYYDENGNFVKGENPNKDGYYDANGNFITYESIGTKDAKGNIVLADGTVITPDGKKGAYDANGNFVEGATPLNSIELSEGAIIDANGNVVTADGTVITPDGKVGYYDAKGNFIEGENPNKDGYYDADGNFIAYAIKDTSGTKDAKGNTIFEDGTVVTPDGKVGYYDANGNFVEGTNPNKDGYYDAQGNFITYESVGIKDSKGNIILADGTVIAPDGTKGYYDKNGKFKKGENPNVGGYYNANGEWIPDTTVGTKDSKGNTILPDGTVILPDGTKGYYNEDGEFKKGENKNKDGYYDENGNFISYESIGTVDSQGNIILADGTVINSKGKKGYYDENGKFHEGTNPYKGGYFDAEGNWISNESPSTTDNNGNTILTDGTVVTADGKTGYYDANGVFHEGVSPYKDGYYDANGNFISYESIGTKDAQGNIILADGTVILPDGTKGYYNEDGVFQENENTTVGGYYDANGNFIADTTQGTIDAKGNTILADGTVITSDGKVGYYDANGNFIEGTNPNKTGYYDANGNFISYESVGTKDSNGNIILADGTVIRADGTKGYYDANGNFVEGTNPNKGGYYDANGNFISDTSLVNTIDTKGNTVLADGTVITSNGKTGYYDTNGNFVEGTNPNKNGYYDANGNFISYESVGTKDSQGNIVLSDGTVITPDGKIGYYNKDGVFQEKANTTVGGYYDAQGNFVADTSQGTIDAKGNTILTDGTIISSDGKVGYYDANGNFVEGANPNKTGYYDAQGNFISYESVGIKDSKGNTVLSDGTVIRADGTKGYYDSNGVFQEGVNPNKAGYYDAQGNWVSNSKDNAIITDAKGNTILADGTVITSDGKLGYYDKNGNFVEGTNTNKDGYYDANGNFISYESVGTKDSKGNTILANGTVINSNGKKGYYDENGKFHEGTNPYKGGYYDANVNFIADSTQGIKDNKGNTILTDGTIISSDGKLGYYDESGNFVEGTNPYKNGYYDANGNFVSYESIGTKDTKGNTVLSDGTVVTSDGKRGYYDENGVFREGKSPYVGGHYDAYGNWVSDKATTNIDTQGNIVLADGTIIRADGTKGYYDKDGVFQEGKNPYTGGYYDVQGNWIETKTNNLDGYYNEQGVFVETSKGNTSNGYYDANGGWVETSEAGYIDKNGANVLPNGTVVSRDGTVGYYDENGTFKEGSNPYTNGFYDEDGVWHSSDEIEPGAYYDKENNLVMSDGTIITSDGKVGYYDKNGEFHEGSNPYVNGYYDSQGNWVADGYYTSDGSFIMSDGTIISTDGKVILPDGTVVEGHLDETGKLVITDDLGGDYYYDEQGNLIKGTNPDSNGFYDSEGNYFLNDSNGFYDKDGTYYSTDGKTGYYDKDGVFHEGSNPYVNGFYDAQGNWHGSATMENVQGYYDENGVFYTGKNPYTDGYYDSEGNWHNTSDYGKTDENGNTIMPNGVVKTSDGKTGYYDENGVFQEGKNPYTDGYYDSEGKWNSYEDLPEGYYIDDNGNLVLSDGTVMDSNGNIIGIYGDASYSTDEPLIGYYDENGNFVTGKENPYENGYYDSEGNWHSTTTDGNTWIDKDGNAYVTGDGLGYYDKDGNLHITGETGYYSPDGLYHSDDGKIGYYDKDGVFHEGEKNPYSGGYYDSQGNWHPDGEIGYYDAQGNWHENVSNTVTGYYDENGVFHEGINPYVNGYYDSEGNWHGEGTPQKAYYNEYGELVYGESPYTDGWYDSKGNFHPFNTDGYFDSNGTFHGKDGTKGYYDADGVFHEGTNPYNGGYYDVEGNWHPTGDSGYYDVNGTYHKNDGSFGYYDKSGNYIEGQENPYTDGWYDSEGNFHPFNSDGYYDIEGNWHSLLTQSDKYKFGSDSYILFTGTWRSPTENSALRLAGNTVQFTINKQTINKVYVDTGIYVALNSILEYEEAKDILHNIAISTNNKFIQDIDSCMIIYNGRIISLNRNERITTAKIKELFENTNIDVKVAKSRTRRKYILVEAIETNQNIKLKYDDLVVTPKYPLTVINNEAYIALSDLSDIIIYNYALTPSGKDRKITFTLKKSIPHEEVREYLATKIIMTTDSGSINYTKTSGSKIEIFDDIAPTVITLSDGTTATYIPVKVIPRLTGGNASFDSNNFILNFNDTDGYSFLKNYYDVSNDLSGKAEQNIEQIDPDSTVK